MTTTVGELNVKIEADLNSIKASMSELKNILEKGASHTAATTKKMESDLSFVALRSKVETAARVVQKAYQMFIDPAIRAEEATNKFNVIFKQNADDVVKWSNQLAPQIARSGRELRGMAADMMAMLDPMSRSNQEAVEMSKGFVLLAQDLSSFHDIPVEEAFEKIRAGVAGEIEPLRRLGIQLDEATLKEEMHRQGLSGKFEELSQGEKTMLRYNAIVRKAGEALGDTTRTANSTANQIRALEGDWKDLSVSIGQIFLPLVSNVVSNARLIIGTFQDITKSINEALPSFDFLNGKLKYLIPVMGQVIAVNDFAIWGLKKLRGETKTTGAEIKVGSINMGQYGDKTKSAAGRIGELSLEMRNFINLLQQGKAGLLGFGEADPFEKAQAKFDAFVLKYQEALKKMTAAQRKRVEESGVLDEAQAASQEEAMNEWFSKFNSRLQAGFTLTSQAMGQVQGIFDQYWSNRGAEVDADYQHRKNVINATIADEETRNMLQAQLDAEYQEKKRKLAVKEAKRRKLLLLASTFMETQSGAMSAFVSALPVAPYPYNMVLGGIAAGIVQTLGTIRMALIAAQEIPEAASGAFATRRTPVIFGEAGAEAIMPLTKSVFRAFAEGIMEEAGLMAARTTEMSQVITTNNNYYNTTRNINLNLDGKAITTVVDKERDSRAYNMGGTNYSFAGAY